MTSETVNYSKHWLSVSPKDVDCLRLIEDLTPELSRTGT